ncbi:BQ2448_4956 [Microbotryum intermedium]|uniref:ATP-dependent DNA helicase n=1 Tax=Microbotryum intermedium TaxID=269621 RepID=A0A238FEL4_9BASI|nr:BQ2448_4956 [Microbotryum intermedium]
MENDKYSRPRCKRHFPRIRAPHTVMHPDGYGKAFADEPLLHAVRARADQAIAVASSGVAVLLLKGGHTTHSTFRIPLDASPTSTCPVDMESDLALLLCIAKLIIQDEASMAHRFAVETVDRLPRDLRGNDTVFGDFCQCLPVVPKGTPAHIVDASLIKADIRRDVRDCRLTENMQLISNADAMDEAQLTRTRDFAECLLKVGEGNTDGLSPIRFAAAASPDGQRTVEGLIILWNSTIDRINAKLLEEIDVAFFEYRSADECISPECLHSVNAPNFPAHHLHPKEGIPVVLLSNFDPDASATAPGSSSRMRGPGSSKRSS